MKIYTQGRLLWDRIAKADKPFARLKGLLGRRKLLEGEGLLITPCSQVHTFHMHFDLDILFITKDMRVADIVTLCPGKVGPRVKEAACILEVPAGSAAQLKVVPGDYITIESMEKKEVFNHVGQ